MRGIALAAVWILATAGATGLAWAGVRSIVADVAEPLPASSPALAAPSDGPGGLPAASASARTRTFELVGGTATVGFSADGVEVLGAIPSPGFAADVEREDGGSRIDFESDDHRSRLRVWWGGGPRHRTEEEARDGGGDDGDDEDEPAGDGDDRSGSSGDGGGSNGSGSGGSGSNSGSDSGSGDSGHGGSGDD